LNGSSHTVAPGVDVVALRTPTLPPAEHTNCYLVGCSSITVIDPGSPWEDQRARLIEELMARAAAGAHIERILLSHRHHDHVAGTMALQGELRARGWAVPIVAHPITTKWLQDDVEVNEAINDLDLLRCGERTLRALWTPGHAPGHLAFHDEASDVMIAGDLVAAVGTIAIDPADGNLGDYLSSLQRIRALRPSVLLPSHGPPIDDAVGTLDRYIAHRHMRSDQICAALPKHQPCGPEALVPSVYPDLHPKAHALATAQIESHLRWLVAERRVEGSGDAYCLQS